MEEEQTALLAFKQRFYDVVKTAEGLLVCLGRSGSQRYLEEATRGIISTGEGRYKTPIQFKAFGNLYDPQPVIELINSFRLEPEPLIDVTKVRFKVPAGKILCVSLEGKTSILTALERAGFSDEVIQECFVEEIVEGGRNSNLMHHLKMRAQAYTCLLYAWGGLRSSPPEVKAGYQYGCHEAPSASQVVELFKKSLTEGI